MRAPSCVAVPRTRTAFDFDGRVPECRSGVVVISRCGGVGTPKPVGRRPASVTVTRSIRVRAPSTFSAPGFPGAVAHPPQFCGTDNGDVMPDGDPIIASAAKSSPLRRPTSLPTSQQEELHTCQS